jgi:surface antigen
MRWAALVSLGAWLALAGPSARGGTAPAPAPSVVGYQYASSCPWAGYAGAIDRWNMYECNCTSFAAWALERNGQRTRWFIAGDMDAWNWPSVARASGFATGSKARVGAVAVWPHVDPPFGHVGYVTRVASDGRFDVAEYNLLIPYDFDRRTNVTPRGATFIYVPRRPAAV